MNSAVRRTDTDSFTYTVATAMAQDTDGYFRISGTAEPCTTVDLFDGGNPAQDIYAVSESYGNWSFELRGVSEGSHSYTVKAIDRAGNTSAASEALTVIVDKSP